MIENWNAQRFEDEVLRDGRLAAVEFYSDGKPMFMGFGSKLDSVARQFSDKMIFGKINVKKEEALAEKYAVRSVPTLMVFCEGRGVGEVVGEADRNQLLRTISTAMEKAEGKDNKKGNSF